MATSNTDIIEDMLDLDDPLLDNPLLDNPDFEDVLRDPNLINDLDLGDGILDDIPIDDNLNDALPTDDGVSEDPHPTPAYETPVVLEPVSTHMTTLILLHGTSTSGYEFAASLMLFDLQSQLPFTRFVFPTGKMRPTTVFEGRDSHAWFDLTSFHDRTMDEANQIQGVKESILYLEGVIQAEIDDLLGDAEKVAVGGFSQGCAMVGMLISSGIFAELGIGGWVGMSGWLPFRASLERVTGACVIGSEDDVEKLQANRLAAKKYVSKDILGITAQEVEITEERPENKPQLWMGHGEDDTKVPLEWGISMKKMMHNLGVKVMMDTYPGLEHGHNEAEMTDLVKFLKERWAKYLSPPAE